MQSVELKKRHLEESYDSLSDELAKLQAQGEALLNVQPPILGSKIAEGTGREGDKHHRKPPNSTPTKALD